jgi:colanic acid biosynthesis glycosyl transferase WcaI
LKILIYSGNFFPELTGVGKYIGEMSFWLARQGHDVRVVTSPPYYPEWKIWRGYRNIFLTSQLIDGVRVFRCPIWVPKNPTAIKRLLHLASFAVSSAPVAITQIFWRPNVVISIEPPLFIAPTSLFLAFVTRAKSIIHIQDFEVDAAFSMNFFNNANLKKAILAIECWLLSKFDLVSTISTKMLQKVSEKNIPDKKRFLLPNWAELARSKSCTFYSDRFGIPADTLIALYSGNMGAKQGLDILSCIAQKFNDDPYFRHRIHFIYCGNGAGKRLLVEQCKGLKNVLFLDLQPSENLSSFLSLADIHLLPQKLGIVDLVMPSKLTGMLASAKPIIASSSPDSELANIVSQCGIVVQPGDPVAFYDALVTLLLDGKLRASLGLAARDYAEKNLNQNLVLSKFESKLEELLQ